MVVVALPTIEMAVVDGFVSLETDEAAMVVVDPVAVGRVAAGLATVVEEVIVTDVVVVIGCGRTALGEEMVDEI